MNTKNKIMIMFCILSWVFCAIGILVRSHSIVGWWITFGGQMACLLAIIVIAVLTIIDLKKEEKELETELELHRKHCEELIKGWLALKLEEDKIEPPEEIDL